MADTNIAVRRHGGRFFYDLGRGNWDPPQLPRLDGTGTELLADRDRIDVLILGDGYVNEPDFRDELDLWIADFDAIDVYERLAPAFRIRALLIPSREPASDARRSHYRVRVKSNATQISMGDEWWQGSSPDDEHFRRELFASVDAFDVNLRRYPDDLDVGSPDVVVGNEEQVGRYRNLVVCLLVRTTVVDGVSGMTRAVPRLDHAQQKVRVAFGRNRLHEFSHAFAMLSDEYIDNERGTTSEKVEPPVGSVLTLSNVTHTEVIGKVPWSHLAPWGPLHRQAAGEEPSPLVGWLWRGGRGHELGVWHAEYRCLMNGTHDNFAFTHDAAADPTTEADGSYTEESGANLRDSDRFCAWCREIVAVRILEKAGRLQRLGDPDGVVEQGEVWWSRWVEELRASYETFFDVGATVRGQELANAALTPGAGGEHLWRSDLFHVPIAAAPTPVGLSAPSDEGEVLVLVTA